MNKKLLALAIAGALAAPLAAQADVTVYGLAHLSFDAMSDDDSAISPGYGIANRASRVGVKASEDVGGGLTAVAQMEWQVDMSGDNASSALSGDNNLTARNQIIGLAGGFGTVAMGRHDTPYKMSTGKLDPFSDQLGDYNAVIMNDRRGNDVLAYLSPNFNGFNVNAAIITNENAPQIDDNDPKATSIALTYGNGPLYVAVANENITDLVTNTRAGIGYDIAGFGLGLVYEATDFDDDVATNDPTAFHLSATYGMGAAKLKAAYGQIDYDVSGVDEATLMAIGVDYSLSKATTIYAVYAAVSDEDAGLLDLAGSYNTVDDGGDQSGLSLGMIYKF